MTATLVDVEGELEGVDVAVEEESFNVELGVESSAPSSWVNLCLG